MFQWLWRLLFESTPAEFRSAFGLAESVERLRAATKRSVFSSLGETAAVGKVSETSVRLQRVIPMISNSFKPFFIGQFEVRDGMAVLVGRFGMTTTVKAFMIFWFGMLALFAGGMLLGKFNSAIPVPGWIVLQPFLMVGFGIALIAAGRWFARNDVAWLSSVIEGALGDTRKSGVETVVPGVLVADPDAVPMTLKVVSAALAASGVMALFSSHFASQLAVSRRAAEGLPFSQWNVVYAAVVIVLSVGVWRRQPWAWWGGFAVLGASFLGPAFALRGAGIPSPLAAIQVVFGVFALVVVAIWGRWWYVQRKHFLWT